MLHLDNSKVEIFATKIVLYEAKFQLKNSYKINLKDLDGFTMELKR
jgi:hypothetical protein